MLPNIFSSTRYDAFCEHMQRVYTDANPNHVLIFEHTLEEPQFLNLKEAYTYYRRNGSYLMSTLAVQEIVGYDDDQVSHTRDMLMQGLPARIDAKAIREKSKMHVPHGYRIEVKGFVDQHSKRFFAYDIGARVRTFNARTTFKELTYWDRIEALANAGIHAGFTKSVLPYGFFKERDVHDVLKHLYIIAYDYTATGRMVVDVVYPHETSAIVVTTAC